MTREQMKKRVIKEEERIYHHNRSLTLDFIDEIYDSFESRICESCSSMRIFDSFYGGTYKCKHGIGNINEYGTIYTELDFGCNKWEAKEIE